MPVSLDTLQQALNTAPYDGYIRLSKDKTGIESYNSSFLGRHFHVHASRSDNQAVRRAFYNSIITSYKCSDAFRASLRQELGIDSHNHDALSVRDAQDILQRVKIAARTMDNKDIIAIGSHFSKESNSVFRDKLISRYQTQLARADKASEFPTIATAFRQPFEDYNRAGIGLKVGKEVIAYIDDSSSDPETRASRNQERSAKLQNFFDQDTTNGMRAARIIGDIVHQGIGMDIMDNLISSRDTVFSPYTLSGGGSLKDKSFIMDFSVNRTNDGSYNIHYTGIFRPDSIDSYDSEGPATAFFEAHNSQITFNMDLVLSFDPKDGKPKIELAQPLTMTGKITPLTPPKGMVVTPMMYGQCKDADSTDFGAEASMEGKLNDSEIQTALFTTQDIDFLSKKLITDSEKNLLTIFNIEAIEIKRMITGLGLNDSAPRLDKKTIGYLLSENPAERTQGLQTLKDIMEAYDLHGWASPDRLSKTRTDIRPEILNLVTVAKLSYRPPDKTTPSEAKLVADYMRQSNDPDHQRMLNDLGSSDQAKVDAAKADIQKLLNTLRPPSTTMDENPQPPTDATPPSATTP